MASVIIIKTERTGYDLILDLLSRFDIVFKVKTDSELSECLGKPIVRHGKTTFTIPYYRNKANNYHLVEMAFEVNHSFQQKVMNNGCLEFTYRE